MRTRYTFSGKGAQGMRPVYSAYFLVILFRLHVVNKTADRKGIYSAKERAGTIHFHSIEFIIKCAANYKLLNFLQASFSNCVKFDQKCAVLAEKRATHMPMRKRSGHLIIDFRIHRYKTYRIVMLPSLFHKKQ